LSIGSAFALPILFKDTAMKRKTIIEPLYWRVVQGTLRLKGGGEINKIIEIL